MACQGVFLLHASAVLSSDGRLVAFVGPSGTGKSTLARLVSTSRGSSDWTLVADDALAVDASGSSCQALVRFPQLKLEEDEQPGPRLPERLKLDALFRLATPSSDALARAVRCQALAPRDGAAVLLSHTIGSRLFCRAHMAEHLGAMSDAAERLRTYDLNYPRVPSVGVEVAELINTRVASDLEEAG